VHRALKVFKGKFANGAREYLSRKVAVDSNILIGHRSLLWYLIHILDICSKQVRIHIKCLAIATPFLEIRWYHQHIVG
jgi:hypothetical protein